MMNELVLEGHGDYRDDKTIVSIIVIVIVKE